EPIRCSATTELARAIVSFSGLPARHGGWAQYRALGSAALELCAVADGSLDAFAVVGTAHLSPWDYLAGHLLVTEAGGAIGPLDGAPLVEVAATRRRLAAASTDALLERVVELASPGTAPS
ncbi:MAG TPA: inositol monophosphatase family protein, partial [Acidimicrobiales bacterium]|nr:inositol monophosphatase family protein [Acidimicrobiales bacterium]